MVRTLVGVGARLGWVVSLALVGCYDGAAGEGDTEGAQTESATDAETSATQGSASEGTDGSATASSASATTDGNSDSDTGSSSGSETDTADGTTGGPDYDPEDAAMVCARWNEDRADMSEGTWSGSVASCDPGDISADGRANALEIMNLYRWLADLPPVTTSPDRDALAQACALMMHANGSLSHDPPMSWTCYSSEGAQGAGNSNISGTPGVAGVDLYMADPGNETTLGHRRWILSNSIGPTGLGSTDSFSCMWTLGGQNNAGKAWTAWPAPGPFPIEAMTASWAPVDMTGWSLQSDGIDLSGAQVEITAEGASLPVDVVVLQPGYGSSSAIAIHPQGWQSQADTTYHVTVTGVTEPIEYDVHMIGC